MVRPPDWMVRPPDSIGSTPDWMVRPPESMRRGENDVFRPLKALRPPENSIPHVRPALEPSPPSPPSRDAPLSLLRHHVRRPIFAGDDGVGRVVADEPLGLRVHLQGHAELHLVLRDVHVVHREVLGHAVEGFGHPAVALDGFPNLVWILLRAEPIGRVARVAQPARKMV